MVLEYLSNGNFANFLKNNYPLKEDTIKFYSAEIVLFLEYLQSQKVVHRDLKPENIMINENYHLQMIDFATVRKIGFFYDKLEMKFRKDDYDMDNDNEDIKGTKLIVNPDDDDDEFSPSDYERTHYALLGKNWRLSLNEQLGAWYVLGAYARMVQDESRKPEDAARWVGRSMWENMLMPHPFISKPVGDLMTDENRHKMDIIASMFIPTSMDNISDLLRMENGFGGSLEDYDFDAIAQAVMGEHKTELSKDIAKKIYGGTENAPSKFKMVTKGEAEEGGIERTDDINPKIVESILRFMPASDFEIIAYLYGFGKGLKNGDTIGKALQEEKLPVFNRFWQRRDPEIYRYNRMQKLNKKYKAILNNYTTLKYNEAALEDQLINRIDLDSTKIAELEKDLRDVQAEIELYEIDGGILPNGISTLEEWARALENYKQAGL